MNKIGRPPPGWLRVLNPGTYLLRDLAEIVNRNKDTVKQVCIKHGALVTYKINKGRVQAFIEWKGFSYDK